MIDPSRVTYDESTQRLTYNSGVKGKKLLPKLLGLALSRLARAGQYENKPLRSVAVFFADRKAASFNATPLKFLGLEAVHSGGKEESAAKFSTRVDFGLEGGKKKR